MQGEIRLKELTKRFDDVIAVDAIERHPQWMARTQGCAMRMQNSIRRCQERAAAATQAHCLSFTERR